jgi:hypothetical protein
VADAGAAGESDAIAASPSLLRGGECNAFLTSLGSLPGLRRAAAVMLGSKLHCISSSVIRV